MALPHAKSGEIVNVRPLANELASATSHAILKTRELEVMRLIASGEALVRISERLQVTTSTVTTYRRRILAKMELKSNADIARYAHEHGLAG